MQLTVSPNIQKFLILCLLAELFSWAGDYLLISDSLLINAYSQQMSYERILHFLKIKKEWEWISYVFLPLFYLAEVGLVCLLIYLGGVLSNLQLNINFMFGVVCSNELLFLLPILIKLLWFLFVQTDYTLQDLNQFYPLSLLNITGTDNIPSYLLYPLQTLNLFEVAYWFLLAQGVSEATGQSFRDSFGLVLSSYGVGLVLWVVLIMFLTITYS